MNGLSISQLASSAGVPATTLRYYERVGLLRADRSPSGYRLYDRRAVERLRFIRAAKRLDLSLASIRSLLEAWEHESCSAVKERLQLMTRARVADADEDIAMLVRLAGVLRRGAQRLDALPPSNDPCSPSCVSVVADPGGDDGAPVVACSLSAADGRRRYGDWHALLAPASVSHTRYGVWLEISADRAAELAELITAEQECCPFLEFSLRFAGPRLQLSITAADADLVADLLPPGMRR